MIRGFSDLQSMDERCGIYVAKCTRKLTSGENMGFLDSHSIPATGYNWIQLDTTGSGLGIVWSSIRHCLVLDSVLSDPQFGIVWSSIRYSLILNSVLSGPL